jgi:hypothetical protein
MGNEQSETLDRLRLTVFGAANGSIACDALKSLQKAAFDGDSRALQVLADYATGGPIGHMRTHAASLLATSVTPGDPRFATCFERLLRDSVTRYWSIDGLLKSRGSEAYAEILALAFDARLPLADRTEYCFCSQPGGFSAVAASPLSRAQISTALPFVLPGSTLHF